MDVDDAYFAAALSGRQIAGRHRRVQQRQRFGLDRPTLVGELTAASTPLLRVVHPARKHPGGSTRDQRQICVSGVWPASVFLSPSGEPATRHSHLGKVLTLLVYS